MIKHRRYLGDGVYVCSDGFQVWLGLSNIWPKDQMIAIAPDVWEQLKLYMEDLNSGRLERR